MLLATTLLISPHTYHYDLCVLLLPILWLVATSPKCGIAYYGMLAVVLAVFVLDVAKSGPPIFRCNQQEENQ